MTSTIDLTAFRDALKSEIWGRATNPTCAGLRIANGGLGPRIRDLATDGTETIASNYGFSDRPLPDAFSIVAFQDGAPVGHASFEIACPETGAEIHLAGIFVDADHRGSGLAKAMTDMAADILEGAMERSLDADPSGTILFWLDTAPHGDFTPASQSLANRMEDRLNAFLEASTPALEEEVPHP